MDDASILENDYIGVTRPDGVTVLRLSGDWTVDRAGDISRAVDAALSSLEGEGWSIDAAGIGRLDTAGARQLRRLLGKGEARLGARHAALLRFLPDAPEPEPPMRRRARPGDAVILLGRYADGLADFLFRLFSFIGAVFLRFAANLARPRHFRPASIVRHIKETGVDALPIVGLLAFLISMVIAYQASIQLRKFGASIFTIDLTTISLLREMGVLITAIMVAGRSGSAFAAEIGVMKLREEVDALKTIGLDPIEILVLPRVIALVLTLPLLAFLADIIGLAGGAMMSVTLLGIPLDQYINRVQSVGTPTMFVIGMIKAPVFAFLIAVIGTYQGMSASGSAESVGRLTTVAVVQSIFAVILADAVFSIVFAQAGI